MYLSDGLLNARVGVVRDDDDDDNRDAGADDEGSDGDGDGDGGRGRGSNVVGNIAPGQGLAPGPGLGFPPEAVLYEVLEYDNARIQAGATFFATPGVYTLRAKFEPWEESWRPFDAMGTRGLQSTLNYLPATKLVKIKVVPERPAPVLLQWAHPAPVTYGALLGRQQFDALLLPQSLVTSPLHNPYNGTTHPTPTPSSSAAGGKATANTLSTHAPTTAPSDTPVHHIYPATYQYFVPNPFYGQNYAPSGQNTGTMSRTR